MKNTFTFLSAFLFAASAVTFIATTSNTTSLIPKGTKIDGNAEEAQSRAAWEILRLSDPSGSIPDHIRQKELAFAATLPNDMQMGRMPQVAYTNRGPWNVGGRTRAFGIDVANENRLLAGSCAGGMWLSTDAGASWNMTSTASQLKNATCLAQDTRSGHTNTWYYGSGEAYGASASANTNGYFLGDGIFKSTDNGANWTQIPTTAGGNPWTFTTGWQLVWNVVNDVSAHDTTEEVYAALYGGIYRTTNGGATPWTPIRAGGSYFTDVALTTTGIMYATLSDDGTQKGIWRAGDGITCTNITPPGFSPVYNRIVIGINPNNENEVYFLANTPGYGKMTTNFQNDPEWNSLWKYTYVSGDGDSAGGVWQDLSINLPNTGGRLAKFIAQGSYDMIVKIKPGGGNTVFLGGTNIYRSTTGFADSTNTVFMGGYDQYANSLNNRLTPTYLNHHSDQHCIEFLPSDPDVMYNTNDGGIYRTMDNTADTCVWQVLNNGYITQMFYTVAIDHGTPGDNTIVAGSQDFGTWYTDDAGPTDPWFHAWGGDGAYCQIADGGTSFYFAIQNLNKLIKANVDATGLTTSHASIDPIGGKGYLWMNPYQLDPNNNNIMYLAGGKYLWRNSNLAGIPMVNNWDSISTNWTQFVDSVPGLAVNMTALTVCKTPANRVYYGTSKKTIYRVDNANVGTPTPVDITAAGSTFPGSGYVSCVAVDPTDGDNVMVVYSNYGVYSMFYSTDAGVTWTKSAGNLEANSAGTGSGPSIRWVSMLPVSDGMVYLAATSTGLYATDSLNGLSTVWVQQGTNTIGNAVCDMIDTRLSDGLVVIATHANGIYSTNITSTSDIVTVHDLASAKSELDLRNYPNPASASTTIEFTLNKKGSVQLQLWDECGRLVRNLANENKPAGKHQIEVETGSLRSGVYYYTLIAENKRRTNKLLIVK